MMNLYISCALGLETVLGKELKHVDFPLSARGAGFCETETDLAGTYYLLRNLRTAERVFLLVGSLKARNFTDLFEALYALPWEQYIPEDHGLRIDKIRLNHAPFRSIPDIQALSQKAICSRLCQRHKILRLRNDVYMHNIRLLVDGETVKVLLDLSGAPLHQRGWRLEGGTAPLKETVAAGMLLEASWKRKYPLWNPFCGSGTIALEALSFAYNLPPNLYRDFALKHLLIKDAEKDARVLEELKSEIAQDIRVRIKASDLDARVLDLAKANFERFIKVYVRDDNSGLEASLRASLVFEQADVLDFAWTEKNIQEAFVEEAGLILANPPYGERLGDQALVSQLHGALREVRRLLKLWSLELITSQNEAEKDFQASPRWKKSLRNGKSEAYLYFYDSFSDSGKATVFQKSQGNKYGKRAAPDNNKALSMGRERRG